MEFNIINQIDIFEQYIYKINMTIQQIKYVLALDRCRHYVKAADSCFVTQSTLTIQVKKLEDEIGVALFDRTKQPLKPTPMGKIFIAKSAQIMRSIRELKDIFNDEYNQTNGTFKVGIIPTLSPYLLPLFVSKFLKEHSETKLEIDELESETIIEDINQGKIDIGIMATPLNESTLREIPVFYEPFVLYANEHNRILYGHKKIKVAQLKSDEIWLLKQGHCFRNQMLNFCNFPELSKIRNLLLEGGSIETLKRIIKETSGYTLIPELSYDTASDKKNVLRFSAPEPAREISLVVQKNFTKERLLAELRKSILEGIPRAFKTSRRYSTVKWR